MPRQAHCEAINSRVAADEATAHPVCSRCALGNLMLGVQKFCDVNFTAFTAAQWLLHHTSAHGYRLVYIPCRTDMQHRDVASSM